VKLQVCWIGKSKNPQIESWCREYQKRLLRYLPIDLRPLQNEAALLKLVKSSAGRRAPTVVLLDIRGKQLSSEELARFMSDQQDRGTQELLFGIGPADGFTEAVRQAATFVLSLSKMTIAHELARALLLEQLYRAFTILKGHPYHTGH